MEFKQKSHKLCKIYGMHTQNKVSGAIVDGERRGHMCIWHQFSKVRFQGFALVQVRLATTDKLWATMG